MAGKQGKDLTIAEINRRAQKIEDAIDAGILSYRKIAKAAGLTVPNLQTTFRKRPDIHKKYRVALLSIQAYAESNMIEAIMDPDNPKCFEASKIFINKYRIEMDEVFEKTGDDVPDVEVSVGKSEAQVEGSTIKISFSSQSKKNKEES